MAPEQVSAQIIAAPQPAPLTHKVRLSSTTAKYAAEFGVTVDKKLGNGSFGTVWLVNHPTHGLCAMKVGNGVQATKRQIKAMQSIVRARQRHTLQHMPVLLETSGDSIAYLMEYYPGDTLGTWIDSVQANPGSITVYEVDSVITKWTYAYAELRKAGIQHTDLHSHNVMYDHTSRKLIIIDVGVHAPGKEQDTGHRIVSELVRLRSQLAVRAAVIRMKDAGTFVSRTVQQSMGLYGGMIVDMTDLEMRRLEAA